MAQAQLTQYNQILGFLQEQLPRLNPTALATTARNIVIDLQNGNVGSIAQHIADATGHEITPETRESVQRVADNVREFAQELRNNVQRDALDQRAAALERTNAMTVLLEANGVPGAYVRGGMIYTADNRPIGTSQEIQDSYNDGTLGDILREHGVNNDFPNNFGDLIPENDSQRTSEMSANGNGRGPPPREPPTDGEAEAQRAAASSGSSFGNPISKETQISRPPTITYGLQETHTTICPFIGWFSVINPTFASPYVVELRMTSPADVLASPNFNAAPGTGVAWPAGVNQAPFDNANNQTNVGTTFPITTASGAVATERAGWFNYWRQIYEYYTVINCEYEIVIHNPTSTNGNAMLMGMDFNSYSDATGATGNKTPQNATITEMMAFKNIKWHTLKESNAINPNENATVIRGNYKPGSTKRNIANDGDVKTWNKTNTGATAPDQPTLKELLTMYFYRHPMNYQVATTLCGVNVQYRLKYTVQFKDLRVQARYPTAAATDITQTIDTDTIMAP